MTSFANSENDYIYPTKKKKLKRGLSILAAGFFPFCGAAFKTLACAFGALNLINFFYLGTLTLSAAAFGPFLPLVIFLGLTVFVMTLGIEDRSFYEALQNKLDTFLGLEEEASANESLQDHEPVSEWKKKLFSVAAGSIKVASIVVPILSSATKAMAVSIAIIAPVYCCYSLYMGVAFSAIGFGALTALGPPGWIILALGCIAGISIAASSLVKEGSACYKLAAKFANWLTDTPASQPRLIAPEIDFRPGIVNTARNTTRDPGEDIFWQWQQDKWSQKKQPHPQSDLFKAKNKDISTRSGEKKDIPQRKPMPYQHSIMVK